jgi:hypothetical protein
MSALVIPTSGWCRFAQGGHSLRLSLGHARPPLFRPAGGQVPTTMPARAGWPTRAMKTAAAQQKEIREVFSYCRQIGVGPPVSNFGGFASRRRPFPPSLSIRADCRRNLGFVLGECRVGRGQAMPVEWRGDTDTPVCVRPVVEECVPMLGLLDLARCAAD